MIKDQDQDQNDCWTTASSEAAAIT